MKNVIDFLEELNHNNNRDWFEANKVRFKVIQEEFFSFVELLIGGISTFDPSVKGVTVKESTYRIYRDTRFSNDKTPYKTYMGAYICRNGKKSSYAGYYFHIEPSVSKSKLLLGSNVLAGGLYNPEPKVLQSIRDEILDNGANFIAAISHAEGFTMRDNSKLKRVPKGYPADSEYAEYLKLKDFSILKDVTNDFLLADNLLERCVDEFKKSLEYNNLLNRAVEYALSEM